MNIDLASLEVRPDFVWLVVIILSIINLYSLWLMYQDKSRSYDVFSERTPEGKLFFWASLFGALGIWLGMFLFHHKKRKWYFYFGIPLIMLENIASLLIVVWLFNY
ncbi:MAG: DUF1294 domain-containing protein [Candidatus Komeilibacteria bacterium CG_4_10_14_0_2_um_filter_37_10]|uniref:DUF1294 domain-containing protein n=1 Tax=Candidatus Komeilibacteria bacterium CG_4_10_14_0_2_um_filter_37_10 TaxID=1974470 RepID=A0A2M7VDB1_9BACT|nr:MAG: DUF1294 domain-containing protein [Candidatus Komeilibacteria bacterium CG_4_10_14_0_2_um_filter_37_10]